MLSTTFKRETRARAGEVWCRANRPC